MVAINNHKNKHDGNGNNYAADITLATNNSNGINNCNNKWTKKQTKKCTTNSAQMWKLKFDSGEKNGCDNIFYSEKK